MPLDWGTSSRTMRYGNEPRVMGRAEIAAEEFCFIQYMPIKLNNSNQIVIPPNLLWMSSLLDMIDQHEMIDNYVYVTAKRLWLTETFKDNRSGWHADGFMTDDINYIWYSNYPTEFCIQDFSISQDHNLSIEEMTEQATEKNIITYPDNTLLRLDSTVIHRANTKPYNGLRTFIKISISKDKYNLIGNAHNYLLDYEWDMKERSVTRNHPVK